MTKPRILLTGARGFVGRQILANLSAGFEVHAISRSKQPADGIIWHDVDLLNLDQSSAIIRDVQPTHLVHSAWETTHGTYWEADSNLAWLEASKSLFAEFCSTGGQRIVGCGTCAEYTPSAAPLRENDAKRAPSSLYGQTKLALSKALEAMPVSSSWARIFSPYGPNEDQRRFVPSICSALLKNEPAKCSSGIQLRNFIDVRDLGWAIASLASHPLTGVINLGHPVSHQLGDVAKTLGAVSGRSDLIKLGAFPDRPNEPQTLIPDLRRQSRDLKFIPKFSMPEGMKNTYAWWQSQMCETNLDTQLYTRSK